MNFGWYVSLDGRHLVSDDFVSDVKLRIDGDFEDDVARVAYANELCAKLNEQPVTFPAGREAGRIGDMGPAGRTHLRVGLDSDNDVYVEVWDHRENEQHGRSASIEFCTRTGGGRSPRTRAALLALMSAMEEDNREEPARRWPPGRDAIEAGG